MVNFLKSTFLFLSGQDSRPKKVDQTELVPPHEILSNVNSQGYLNVSGHNLQTPYHSVTRTNYDMSSISQSMPSQSTYSGEIPIPNSDAIESPRCFNIPNPMDSIHKLVRLGGKQRPCVLCKRFCKKTPCGDNIRTYYKCAKCDVPLCKGPIRNCYKDFHENLGQTTDYVVLENTMK